MFSRTPLLLYWRQRQQVPPQMNANTELLGECVLRHFFSNRQRPLVCGPNAKKPHEHCGCRFCASNPYSACYVWLWMLALWTPIIRLFVFVFSPSTSLLRKYFRTDRDHFLTKCHLYAPFHLTTHNQCNWKSVDTNQESLNSDRNCTSSFRHLFAVLAYLPLYSPANLTNYHYFKYEYYFAHCPPLSWVCLI